MDASERCWGDANPLGGSGLAGLVGFDVFAAIPAPPPPPTLLLLLLLLPAATTTAVAAAAEVFARNLLFAARPLLGLGPLLMNTDCDCTAREAAALPPGGLLRRGGVGATSVPDPSPVVHT